MRGQAEPIVHITISRRYRLFLSHIAVLVLATFCFLLALGAATASASKQAVDYFGTESGSGTLGGEFDDPNGIAVNNSGAGPASKGDVYVVDQQNNRVERFARNDNGTPAEPADDTYEFISAWGAGVDSTIGGSGYQVCTIASQCQAGIASSGNGALGLRSPGSFGGAGVGASGIAVDQDSGEVYVTDAANFRVNVYTGGGAFLRSFGYDVVASGPDRVPAPNERQQLTLKASGGKFSLSFDGRSTGPRGRGGRDGPGSTNIRNFVATEGTFAVGQSVSGEGIAPGTTITEVGAGRLRLSQPETEGATDETPIFVDNLPHNASAEEVEASLNALPSIGGAGGSVTVSGGPGDPSGSTPYTIEFGGALGEEDQRALVPSGGGLTVGGSASATTATLVDGGAYEVCKAAAGDVCKEGGAGSGIGEMGESNDFYRESAGGITVSQPDGNPTTGTVFLADTGNHRVNTYNLDGTTPDSFGASVFAAGVVGGPTGIAVDSRGVVYASNSKNNHEIERYDSQNANGGGVGFLAPIASPPLISSVGEPALAVDPDTDGAGPDTDVLFALQHTNNGLVAQQFGPLNAPGLTVPPSAADDEHGTSSKLFTTTAGLALDESDGRLYVTAENGAGQAADGVYVLDNPGPPPAAALDSLSDITSHSVTAQATISPNGPPDTSYHLEYSLDGSNWKSTQSIVLGNQKAPQAVEALLDPPGGGLEPSTFYHLRLVAKRPLIAAIVTSQMTFTTLPAPPIVETTGSPVRTATAARLEGRVDPNGTAATYSFEYGTQGPCDANPCASTEAHAAGSGKETELVSQQLTGLESGTTYHYRVLADNGNPGSPSFGGDMTATTYASNAPLSHGHLSGPPGSDRAWEQVNQPDTGGNQVQEAFGFSAEGNRALFRIAGGTPDSETGSLFAFFFSERTPSGWQVKQITPQRSELVGANWEGTLGNDDLSAIVSGNTEYTRNEAVVWRFDPFGQPAKLFQLSPQQEYRRTIGLSADGTRTVVLIKGQADPAYPGATGEELYDVSSGAPHLVNLLPGGAVPACGVGSAGPSAYSVPRQETHWVSPDGSLVFFPSRGDDCHSAPQLYVRDIEAEETKLISGPTVSGPSCGVAFLKGTPDATFFWTQSRLAAQDTAPADCSGSADGDVYRYGLSDGSLECVTCAVAGLDADVSVSTGSFGAGPADIAVADNGSRVYFSTSTRLLPGAPRDGEPGAYRVNVASGDLAYIGPGSQVGQTTSDGNAITPDGSVLMFRSSGPGLNALGGQQNGGTAQFYRYDDRDRSLICVSCPADGSPPLSGVSGGNSAVPVAASAEGDTVAFTTPTPLVGADLNTAVPGQQAEAGVDAYEWRDGRLLLITDGISDWTKGGMPQLSGISASGRDIFFLAAAQYTQDALDGYQRLYDARIGGGFEFPKPPPPCPLEVCQGTPKGAPEEAAPGTGSFSGPGNASQDHRRKKHRKKAHKRHRRHRAGNNGRAAR